MTLDIACLCRQGGQAENQDQVLALERPYEDVAVLVAADGLGGHRGGARASRLAVRSIVRDFLRHPSLEEETLLAVFEQANRRILEKQRTTPGMRSTAAAVFVHRGQAAAAYVGDTRIYRFRQGRIVCQSLDHSVPQMLVYAGEILPGQIRFHPDRNRLLRALGGENCRPQLLPPVPLLSQDDILLCTDGFWEYVLEEEMERILSGPCTAAEGLERMEQLLLARVRPGHDNYSAILLRGHTCR